MGEQCVRTRFFRETVRICNQSMGWISNDEVQRVGLMRTDSFFFPAKCLGGVCIVHM